MSNTLPTTETVSFEDCGPGTVLEVSGLDFPTPQVGTVIQMLREFGGTHIPALLIKFKELGDEPRLVTASGRNRLTVIRSVKNIAGETAPEAAVKATLIPATVTALEFSGGAQRATEIIRWTAGSAAFSYMPEEGLVGEHLILHRLNVTTKVELGDWVIKHKDGRFEALTAEAFAAAYDVDPAQLGLIHA